MAALVIILLTTAVLIALSAVLLGGAVRIAVRAMDPALAWAAARQDGLPPRLRRWLDPARGELPGLAVLGATLIGSAWLMFGVMQDLIAGDPLVHADHAVLHLLLSLQVAWVVRLAMWWRWLGSGVVVVALGTGAVLWLDRQRAWRAMAYVVAALFGSLLFAAGLDVALARPAPFIRAGALDLLPFPGTHLAALTALLGFLTVVICRERGAVARFAVGTATMVFLLGSLAARLYLGDDYLSTALEVMAFGLTWAVMLGFAYLTRPAEAVGSGGLGIVVMVAVLGLGGLAGLIGQAGAQREPAMTGGTLTMSRATWLAGGWRSLPRRPLSLFGTFSHPFALQFLGPPQVLRETLAAHGWHTPPAWREATLAAMLTGRADPVTSPVPPRLDDGRWPEMVMTRNGGALPDDERIVFRLWRSHVVIPSAAGGSRAVWLGAVAVERIGTVARLFAVPQNIGRYRMARRWLSTGLGGSLGVTARPGPILLASAPPGSRR
jgi:undecaprenyl-diphosphatase